MARQPKQLAGARQALGRRLAFWCEHRGWTQHQLGAHTAYSRSSIAHIQRGEQTPGLDFWRTCDELLDADGELATAYAEYEQAKRAWHEHTIATLTAAVPLVPVPRDTPDTPEMDGPDGVDVNRKQFLAGLAATVAAPGLVLSGTNRARVTASDVARYRANLAHLYALDDHYGASGEVYALTVRSMRHLLRALEHASYTPWIGDELRSVAGQLMEHAGWLAFDAGHVHDARYWWLEALHTARMASDTTTEVVVLGSMSVAASRDGRGREAVDLARVAVEAAKPRSTPRLRSLLVAREALGHARTGDQAATTAALKRAHAELEHDRRDSDPAWLDFWGPSDLAGHVTQSALYLRDLPTAEHSARDSLTAVDAASHPRNHALYQGQYATALVGQHKIDEALPILAGAAVAAVDLNSHRLASDVHAVTISLHHDHADMPEVRELHTWTTANLTRTPAPWPTTL